MTDIHSHNKSLIGQLRQAMYNYEPQEVLETLEKLFHDDAIVHLCFPFEDLDGAEGLFTEAYKPLYRAIPDLERRDTIVISAPTAEGDNWVGDFDFDADDVTDDDILIL